MGTIRLLHTADLHLGASYARLGSASERLQAEQLDTFDRICDLAIRQKVNALLVAGDLFDSYQVDEQLLARVRSGFARLQEQHIEVVGIPGTHDTYDHPRSVYRKRPEELGFSHLFTSPKFGEPYVLEADGQTLLLFGRAHVIGESPTESLEGLRRQGDDAYHVALLHISVGEASHWENRAQEPPVTVEELGAVGFDYWALGHHHSFGEIWTPEGKEIGAYPGTPLARKFGESGDRFVVLVDLLDEGVRLDKVRINRIRFEEKDFDVSGLASPDELVDKIRGAGKPQIVCQARLVGIADFPIDVEAVRARASDAYLHLHKLEDGSQLWKSEYIEVLRDELTVKGIFVRRMLEKMEAADEEERGVLQQALKIGILAAERTLP